MANYVGVCTDLNKHFTHCRDRLNERYGEDLTLDEWEQLNGRIYRESDCTFLFQPNHITSVYKLCFRGRQIGVMFSEAAFCVTSLLPETDCRLFGMKPDGTPGGNNNFVSPQREQRLAAAGVQLVTPAASPLYAKYQ